MPADDLIPYYSANAWPFLYLSLPILLPTTIPTMRSSRRGAVKDTTSAAGAPHQIATDKYQIAAMAKRIIEMGIP